MPANWFETFFRGVAVDAWRQANCRGADLGGGGLARTDAPPAPRRPPCWTSLAATDAIRSSWPAAPAASPASISPPTRWAPPREPPRRRAPRLPGGGPTCAAFPGARKFGGAWQSLRLPGPLRRRGFSFGRRRAQAARPLCPGSGDGGRADPPGAAPRRRDRLGDIFLLRECRCDACASPLDMVYTFLRGGVVETRASSS